MTVAVIMMMLMEEGAEMEFFVHPYGKSFVKIDNVNSQNDCIEGILHIDLYPELIEETSRNDSSTHFSDNLMRRKRPVR